MESKDVFLNKLLKIHQYYQSVSSHMKEYAFPTSFKDEKGVFIPNDLIVFYDLVVNGIIQISEFSSQFNPKDRKVLGAGSGDGRELAVASLFGFLAYGIELDKGLVDISNKACQDLYKKKIIKEKFNVVQGTFNKDEPYGELGINFSDLDYIIHSMNNTDSFTNLLKKFSEESKDNAKLFLLAEPITIVNLKKKVEKYNLSISKPYPTRARTGLQRDYAIIS